jgi:hypothetical protein
MKNNTIVLLFLSISTLFLRSCALIRDSQDETNIVKMADNPNMEQNNEYGAGMSETTCSHEKIDYSCSVAKGREKKTSIPVANRYCFDKYGQCAGWVEEERNIQGGNLCESNPSFLKVVCRLSCGVCTPTHSFPWCQDFNMECGYWASIGECERNAPYMVVNCKRSCNQCPLDPIQRHVQLQHESGAPQMGDYIILKKIHHSANSFTQGLTYNNYTGILYESIGNYGKSEIRAVDPKTGKLLDKKFG